MKLRRLVMASVTVPEEISDLPLIVSVSAKCMACRHRLALWCRHCVDNATPTPEPTR